MSTNSSVNTNCSCRFFMKTQMFHNNKELEKNEEKILLDALSLEVDNIFLGLRKADQVIRRELNLLNKKKLYNFQTNSVDSINDLNLQQIIEQIPKQHFLLDEYVAYMLNNENNSLFDLIKEYNSCVAQRNQEKADNNLNKLLDVDERLVYYIRHLGAMMYHLNIHLNLLNVLFRNGSPGADY